MNYCYSQQLGRNLLASRGDADALAYVAAVRAAGGTVSGAQQTAINTFYVDAKAGSYYTSLKRLYLPIWGVAAANAIDMIGLTSGTFNGSVTHASGYVQGNGSTGYFDIGASPISIGANNGSIHLHALLIAGGTGACGCIGSDDGSGSRSIIYARQDINDIYFQHANAATEIVNPATAPQGIVSAGWLSGSGFVAQRRASGRTVTTTSGSPAGTISPVNFYAMAHNITGIGPAYFVTQGMGAWGCGMGLSSANDATFTLALKNLWEQTSGLTLP